jgi:1,6-anhydro-N-acetylmuramate kinase
MEKIYSALGLMSGTSMDGIDASIIKSNGEDNMRQFLINILSTMKKYIEN